MDENLIIVLEKKGIVTATFRRLEPAKRQKIYQSALESFSKEIFQNVSLDEIAAGAEISKGSIVQYFSQKENLFRFVSETYLDDYRSYWENYFRRELAIRVKDRILQYFRARLDLWDRDRSGYRFYLKILYENDFSLRQEFSGRIFQFRQNYLMSIIVRGIETGEIRRDTTADEIFFALSALTSAFDQACRDILSSPRDKINLGNTIDRVTAMLFDGIGG